LIQVYSPSLGELSFLQERNRLVQWVYRKRIEKLLKIDAEWKKEVNILVNSYNIPERLTD